MTFLIAFVLMSFMMQVLTGFSIFSILVPSLNGKSIHSIATNRREKELTAKDPEYDEWGYRKDYDPHYVRALEIDTGVSVSELTTCSDENCRICLPGVIQTVESQVKVPVALPGLNEKIKQLESKVNEEKEAAEALARKVKAEAVYHKKHMPSEFRPKEVPKRACCAITQYTNGKIKGISLRWSWDDQIYVNNVPGYEIINTEDGQYLRKRKPEGHRSFDGVTAMSGMQIAEGILAGRLYRQLDDSEQGIYKVYDRRTQQFIGYIYQSTLDMLLTNAELGW